MVGTQNPVGTFNGLTAGSYTFTATDNNSCSVATTAMVTEPPVASTISSCPPSVVVNADVNCKATVNYNLPNTTVCAVAQPILIMGLSSGSAFSLGITTNTYSAKDVLGEYLYLFIHGNSNGH